MEFTPKSAKEYLKTNQWVLPDSSESRWFRERVFSAIAASQEAGDPTDLLALAYKLQNYIAVRRNLAEQQIEDDTSDYYVTLSQMAAVVGGTSKRTIRRLYDSGELPVPAIEGGKGKANQWRWTEVRPILEKQFDRQLPERFPADRFVRA